MTLNISVGNAVWWMVIALGCAVTAFMYLLLRKKQRTETESYAVYRMCHYGFVLCTKNPYVPF